MTRPEDKIDQALQRMSEGGQVDPVLQSYADSLRRMQSLRPTPDRDPQTAAGGRQAFLNEAASQAVSRPALSRHRVRTFDGRKEIRPMSAVIGLLMALALLFGGGGAAALAAQDALPDEALYGVKLATEDLQLGLTTDPVQETDLLGNFIDRRFQEMHQLVRSGEAVPLKAVERLERQLGEALQTAAKAGDPEMTQLLERLQIRLETNLQIMDQLRTSDPNGAALREAQQAMVQTHAEIQGALEDPAAFRIRYGAGRPDDAPVQPDVIPGEQPVDSPGTGGEGSGQGPNSDGGQGPATGQGGSQGDAAQGAQHSGDGTCECTARGDGLLVCTTACEQYQYQHQGTDNGYGVGTANCACTPQEDGTLLCSETCDPYFFHWATPGPNGYGQGSGGPR